MRILVCKYRGSLDLCRSLTSCEVNRTWNSRQRGLTCSCLPPHLGGCVHVTFHPPEHRSPRGRVPPAPFGFRSPFLTWAHLGPPVPTWPGSAGGIAVSREPHDIQRLPAVLPAEVPPEGGHERAPPGPPAGTGVQGLCAHRFCGHAQASQPRASPRAWVVGVGVRGDEPQAGASLLLTWYVETVPPSAHQALV